MKNSTEVAGWIARAAEDYTRARSALRRKKPLIYGAAFHAGAWEPGQAGW